MMVKQPTSYVYDLSFHKFLKIFVMKLVAASPAIARKQLELP